MKLKSQQTKGSLLLVLTAFIWGVAFVAQSAGMAYVGPFTFVFARNVLGCLTLLIFMALTGRLGSKKQAVGAAVNVEAEGAEGAAAGKKTGRWTLWIGGLCCGCALFGASMFQQIGIQETTVGKAGFITALYIVIVPVLGLFFKKRVLPQAWAGVAIAVVGMYLLCMTEGSLTIARGDLMVICCALVFSCHILIVDHFSPMVDGVKMSCIQFAVCTVLGGISMALAGEQPTIEAMQAAFLPIAYAGVMSSGVAYTLQIVGQKYVPSTIASLIMSLESVFSALAGWALLGETLSLRELLGCGLIFGAIILAQLPERKRSNLYI